jgi:surface antigen
VGADDPIYGGNPTSAMPHSDYRSHRRMATTKKAFQTILAGTSVTWHYRSAIGHGTVVGVHKMGTTADNTMYDVEQHDHHPGEPAIVHHTGKALSKSI